MTAPRWKAGKIERYARSLVRSRGIESLPHESSNCRLVKEANHRINKRVRDHATAWNYTTQRHHLSTGNYNRDVGEEHLESVASDCFERAKCSRFRGMSEDDLLNLTKSVGPS